MDITKVKLTTTKKDEQRTRVEWVEESPKGAPEDHSMSSPEARHPDLDDAISALVLPTCRLLRLPDTYAEKMSCTGLTLTEEGEDRSATITCLKELSVGILVLNTPHTSDLPGPLWMLIDAVVREAKAYAVGGKRGQLDMFGQGEDSSEERGTDERVAGVMDGVAAEAEKAGHKVTRTDHGMEIEVEQGKPLFAGN